MDNQPVDVNSTDDTLLKAVAEKAQDATDAPPPQDTPAPPPGADGDDWMNNLPPAPDPVPMFKPEDTAPLQGGDDMPYMAGDTDTPGAKQPSSAGEDTDGGFDEIDLLNLFNLGHSYTLKWFTGSDSRIPFQIPEEDIDDIGRQLRPFMPKVKSKVPKGLILFITLAMIIAPMWVMAFSMRRENMKLRNAGAKATGKLTDKEKKAMQEEGANNLPKMQKLSDAPAPERTNFKIHANGAYVNQWNGVTYTYTPVTTQGTVKVDLNNTDEIKNVLKVNNYKKLLNAFGLTEEWLKDKHQIEIGK